VLNNIKLGYSPLGEKIYLYRHGKDAGLALEKREAEADVMAVLVQKMMADSPKGSKLTFALGDKSYVLTLEPAQDVTTTLKDGG
jgi:hypothetical protein